MIASLPKGDVIFTNFEGTVAKAGQPNENVLFQGSGLLARPEALDTLKALGFNLLSLSNNHSSDLKVPGIRNTLEQVNRLNLAISRYLAGLLPHCPCCGSPGG
jgi:poly-gamma-glutamate capsule biosynthesis protein CapA/YwtB (metallophosphatase superfamily)